MSRGSRVGYGREAPGAEVQLSPANVELRQAMKDRQGNSGGPSILRRDRADHHQGVVYSRCADRLRY
jgi:hypothetical protein